MIQFTLTAPDGSFTTTPIGRVAGGYRLQIDYKETMTFEGVSEVIEPTGNRKTEPIRGNVVAGSDWVLLRDDGVAVFDARITFRSTEPNGHVFDGELSGQVPLSAFGDTFPIKSPTNLKELGGPVPVSLPITFETSQPAPPGASKAIDLAATHFRVFAELARDQFLAKGTIVIKEGALLSAVLKIASVDAHIADGVRVATPARVVTPAVGKSDQGPIDPVVKMIVNADRTKWDFLKGIPVSRVVGYLHDVGMTGGDDATTQRYVEDAWKVEDWGEAERAVKKLGQLIYPDPVPPGAAGAK